MIEHAIKDDAHAAFVRLVDEREMLLEVLADVRFGRIDLGGRDGNALSAQMAGFVEETARKRGIEESLWMTVGVTDGSNLYAVRYASDGEAPTLYHSRDIEAVCHLNPDLREHFGVKARAIVSEPIGLFPEIWHAVPQNSSVHVKDACFETRPFVPLD